MHFCFMDMFCCANMYFCILGLGPFAHFVRVVLLGEAGSTLTIAIALAGSWPATASFNDR